MRRSRPVLFTKADVSEENVAEVILWCIRIDDMSTFYQSSAWRRLREQVMQEHRKDGCLLCKERGFYRRATTLHHERHVRQYPALALSRHYTDGEGVTRRQLWPVCAACHRTIHGSDKEHAPEFTTEERWD